MEAGVTISSIVLIVILIVPGVFFKRFYFQGEFTKQFGAGLFADRLITSVFWGLIVQIITFIVFSQSFNLTYDTLKEPVNKVYIQLSTNNIPDLTTQNLWYILGYLLMSILISAFLGHFLHKVVRIFKIDVRFRVFRFSNQWNYYFRGDILASDDFKKLRKGKVLSTLVDVVVDTGDGKPKMISGFLSQYNISKNGELETIYLTDAKRFSHTTNKFKDVLGDC